MATSFITHPQPTRRVLEMKPRCKNPTAKIAVGPISQHKLQRIAELADLESKVVRERRELLLEIEAELASGAELETGELTYYRELKLVGKRQSSPVRNFVFNR